MRVTSESKPGKIIASRFVDHKEHDIDFRVNVMLRKYLVNDKIRHKTEFVLLIREDQNPPRQMIMTELGPVCGICKTSDYIKEDKSGDWFDKKYLGCTCTRCGTATLS